VSCYSFHAIPSTISGFHCDVEEICTLLGYYAASSGNPLLTFQNNALVPSSRAKKPWSPWPSKMGPTQCPKTLLKDDHSTLRNIPEECRSHAIPFLLILLSCEVHALTWNFVLSWHWLCRIISLLRCDTVHSEITYLFRTIYFKYFFLLLSHTIQIIQSQRFQKSTVFHMHKSCMQAHVKKHTV
jgi:hypothetical protein